jgi:hypothetical protein
MEFMLRNSVCLMRFKFGRPGGPEVLFITAPDTTRSRFPVSPASKAPGP